MFPGQGGRSCDRYCFSANSAITIPIANGNSPTQFVRVFSTSTLVDIGAISFDTTAGTPTAFDFLIGASSALITDPVQPLSPAVANWLGFDASSPGLDRIRMSAAIAGNLNGNNTTQKVIAKSIVRLQVQGDLQTDVETSLANGVALGWLQVNGEIAAGATVRATGTGGWHHPTP